MTTRAMERDFALLAGLAPHLCADAIDATPEAAAAAERVNRLLDRIGGAGLDPHLPAMAHVRAAMRAATEGEARAARRRLERVTLGGCPCGEVAGEALCPWCDDATLPEGLRMACAMMRRRARARGKLDVEAVVKALAPKPKAEPAGATRSPNRHERRRAASRRWRG
jgi:hypothetical protein